MKLFKIFKPYSCSNLFNIKVIVFTLLSAYLSSLDNIYAEYDEIVTTDWLKSFGGSSDDIFSSVINTDDGGYALCGYSKSTDAGFENKGNNDAIIAKYDKNGKQLWFKTWGGSGEDCFRVIKELPDKNLVVVGNSNSADTELTNKGSTDGIISKYDSNGNQLWIKNVGGSAAENIKAMDVTQSGDILIGMHSGSSDTGAGNNGGYDIYLIKIDTDGNQKWIKNYGGSATEYVNSVLALSTGNIILAGHTYSENFTNSSTSINGDAVIFMTDENGNVLWQRHFGGSDNDYFTATIQTSDGNIIATGASYSNDYNIDLKGELDGIIVKYDFEGNVIWHKNFGGSLADYSWNIAESWYDGFFCIGYSHSDDFIVNRTTKSSTSSAYIIKFNKDGEEEWIKHLSGTGNDRFNGICVLSDGNIILVGQSSSGDIGFTNTGGLDAIMMKYNIKYELIPENNEVKNSLYLKPDSTLNISLNTSQIIFDNFSISEDAEKLNVLTIGITSSLPYELKLSLDSDIIGLNYGDILDSSAIKIKLSTENDYKDFSEDDKSIVLAQNQESTMKTYYSIDMKVMGTKMVKSDIYKATLKYVANQI